MLPHEFPLKIRVLSADPPWKFGDKLPGETRGAEKNYTCLTLDEIKAFKLPPLADDVILFLWRVSAMQQEALDVVKAWGFTVKSELVWVKKTKRDLTAIGMGRYVRGAHETCLIATRGSFAKHVADKGIRSVLECPLELEAPIGEHSEKPDAFYELVEALVGGHEHGPMVELFGRKTRANWHVFGNEIPNGYSGSLADPSLETSAYTNGVNGAAVPATELGDYMVEDRWQFASFLARREAPEERELTVEEARALWGLTTVEPVANGEMPHHVIPELGEHPALVEAPSQYEYVAAAMKEGFFKSPDDEPLAEAWVRLQFAAPAGFFRRTREAKANGTLDLTNHKPKPAAHNPIENLSDLVDGLKKAGVDVSLVTVSGWSVNDRGRAFDWLDRGADMKAVPAIIGEAFKAAMIKETGNPNIAIRNSGCAGCDNGKPYTNETVYLHTGEGPSCRESARKPGDPAPPKKKGGRRKKANGAEWDSAMARARIDIGIEIDENPEDFGQVTPV